ncbi:MAG: hypothetical protein FH762_10100 [Firmicutes bacterium]|nr:hypothetical protein [Bacillota bacterium]
MEKLNADIIVITGDLIDRKTDDLKNVFSLFTDLSNFFLNEARTKLKKYPFLTYGPFDINKEYWKQGYLAINYCHYYSMKPRLMNQLLVFALEMKMNI